MFCNPNDSILRTPSDSISSDENGFAVKKIGNSGKPVKY